MFSSFSWSLDFNLFFYKIEKKINTVGIFTEKLRLLLILNFNFIDPFQASPRRCSQGSPGGWIKISFFTQLR